MEEQKEDQQKKLLKFPNMPKDKLAQLAKDIAMDKVFCSCFMKEYEMHNLGMVFMPIVFGAFADLTEEQKKDIGFIYEYYDKAPTGRSINGMPIFFSCAAVSRADAKRIFAKVDEIRKVLKDI